PWERAPRCRHRGHKARRSERELSYAPEAFGQANSSSRLLMTTKKTVNARWMRFRHFERVRKIGSAAGSDCNGRQLSPAKRVSKGPRISQQKPRKARTCG